MTSNLLHWATSKSKRVLTSLMLIALCSCSQETLQAVNNPLTTIITEPTTVPIIQTTQFITELPISGNLTTTGKVTFDIEISDISATNNTISTSQATSLDNGYLSIIGIIASSGDNADIYTVPLSSGQSVKLNKANHNTGLNLSIYDNLENLVYSSDDSPATFTAETDGTYFIAVSSNNYYASHAYRLASPDEAVISTHPLHHWSDNFVTANDQDYLRTANVVCGNLYESTVGECEDRYHSLHATQHIPSRHLSNSSYFQIADYITTQSIQQSSTTNVKYRINIGDIALSSDSHSYSHISVLGAEAVSGNNYKIATYSSSICLENTGFGLPCAQNQGAYTQRQIWQITEDSQLYSTASEKCLSTNFTAKADGLIYPKTATCDTSDAHQKFAFDTANNRIYSQAYPNNCLALYTSVISLTTQCANYIDNYTGEATYASNAYMALMPTSSSSNTLIDFNWHDSSKIIRISELHISNGNDSLLEDVEIIFVNDDDNPTDIRQWLSVLVTPEIRRAPSLIGSSTEASSAQLHGNLIHQLQLSVHRDNLDIGDYKGQIILRLTDVVDGETVLQELPIDIAMQMLNPTPLPDTNALVLSAQRVYFTSNPIVTPIEVVNGAFNTVISVLPAISAGIEALFDLTFSFSSTIDQTCLPFDVCGQVNEAANLENLQINLDLEFNEE